MMYYIELFKGFDAAESSSPLRKELVGTALVVLLFAVMVLILALTSPIGFAKLLTVLVLYALGSAWVVKKFFW